MLSGYKYCQPKLVWGTLIVLQPTNPDECNELCQNIYMDRREAGLVLPEHCKYDMYLWYTMSLQELRLVLMAPYLAPQLLA